LHTANAVSAAHSRKNQVKKVVCHVPADGSSSDMWAWRKYGQKPIKGSPYPRSVSQNNPLFLSQLLAGVASGQTDLTACCSIS
jgi:hypothetical protein